jgi:hypothetical protein
MTAPNSTISDIHPMLARLNDQAQLSTWLVRYFFSEKKSHNKWWSASVNESNVLLYISQANSNFPLSPKDVCDDWFLKKSLSNTDLTDFDFEVEEPKAKKAKKEAIYNTGVASLKDIGHELHGITAMMALKLETSGTTKLQTLAGTNGYYEGLAASMDLIIKAENEVASDYAKLIGQSKTVDSFLTTIKKQYQITPLEMLDISTPGEKDMIAHLLKQDAQSIAQYLKGDILKEQNRMKSYQTMLSRHLYPAKRRGRPKKQVELNS